MPDVPSIGHGSVGPINRAASNSALHGAQRAPDLTPRDGDRVELSEHARLLDRLRQLPEVRLDLVKRVRAEITAGTYETPQRLDAAIERLLEDVRL